MTKKRSDYCIYCEQDINPLTYSHIEWCKQDSMYRMIKDIRDILKHKEGGKK